MLAQIIHTKIDSVITGVVIAIVIILAVIVYCNNKESSTNRAFLFLSILTTFWALFDHLSYISSNPLFVLWIFRILLFIAVWHAYSFFHLAYVFPKEKIDYPTWYKNIIFPTVAFTSIIPFTPLTFLRLNGLILTGQVSIPQQGLGVLFISILMLALITMCIILLLKKTTKAQGIEKKKMLFVSIGIVSTVSLIIIFNLILPAVFSNGSFIPFAPLALLPFLFSVSYAIYKYKLFDLKIIVAEIILFLMWLFILVKIILVDNRHDFVLQGTLLVVTVSFGVLLIRNIFHAIRQNEIIQKLTADLDKACEIITSFDAYLTEAEESFNIKK